MSKTDLNFVDKCLAGEVLVDEIDDYVDLWHEGEGDPDSSLAEFLGFTDEEYKLWAENPKFLPFLLNARKLGVPLEDVQDYDKSHRIAAEGLSEEVADELSRWLKGTGRISN